MTMPIAKSTPLETLPVETLPVIEQEFAAGNYVESSRLLWEATKNTFLMLGKAHGLHTDDTRTIAYALDGKYGLKMHYLGVLIAGGLAQDHAEMEALEYHELEIPHRCCPNSFANATGSLALISTDTPGWQRALRYRNRAIAYRKAGR